MAAFWEGAVAGYGIAIPVGAIAILIVDTAMRMGFERGFMAGAGAATADLLYASLAMIAGGMLSRALAPFATGLGFVSASVLFTLGGYGLLRARSSAGGNRTDVFDAQAHGRLYTYGQFLGLTLLNPLTIAYFSALILGRDASQMLTLTERLAFVTGAALASFSWQTLLAGLGAFANRYLSARFRMLTSVLGNLIVIGLGGRILMQLLL